MTTLLVANSLLYSKPETYTEASTKQFKIYYILRLVSAHSNGRNLLSLSLIFWSTIVFAFIAFWWQSDKVKSYAMGHILRYCKERNLQLLDQTMVLRGLWPMRSGDGSLGLRRRYHFEFTSTGAMRSKGIIELIGRQINRLEIEAHLLPEDEENIH